MSNELQQAIEENRPALLRHCYRMLGSIFDAEETLYGLTRYGEGDLRVPTLFALATHACLEDQVRKRPLRLPHFGTEPSTQIRFGPADPARWVTPAADAELFGSAAEKDGERESLTLDYLALLQTLSPLQRAAYLASDRLGFSIAEISQLLELTESGVASAVRRAQGVMAQAPHASERPAVEAIAQLVRAWESHDLDGVSRLLHPDAILAMPPFEGWLHGSGALRGFFGSARFEAFWARRIRVKPTDANGGPALAFYRPGPDGVPVAQAIMALRFESARVAEVIAFVGRRYFHGFEIPTEMDPVAQGGPLS